MKTKVNARSKVPVMFRITPVGHELLKMLAENLNTTQAGAIEAGLRLLAERNHIDVESIRHPSP